MTRFLKARSHKLGLPPGTLARSPEPAAAVQAPQISVLSYGKRDVEALEVDSLLEANALVGRREVSWIHLAGHQDEATLAQLSDQFGLHPLTVEDMLHTDQRAKMEIFDDYIYLVVQHPRLDADQGQVRAQQLSIILTRKYLLTVAEGNDDWLEPVRRRIRLGQGNGRGSGTDYLAYMLLDLVVDHYFAVLEQLGVRMEGLESELLDSANAPALAAFSRLRRELLFLRKTAWPLRDVVGPILRGESPIFRAPTRTFMRDVHDHAVQVIETIEIYREMLATTMEMHLSLVSNRMNEVMKVLTIIATIFIPLTFVVGVYGMNFRVMPELDWAWGYPVIWLVMIAIGGGLVWLFRRKGWM